MKFNGENLKEVIEEHMQWVLCPTDDSQRADFSGADLTGFALPFVHLYGANFRGANLFHADLYCADLQKADLTGANLYDANLFGTRLRGAVGVGYIPQRIPTDGSFIAWKRAKLKVGETHYDHSVIVKLLIPEDAERISFTNGECKASKAKVLEIQTVDGEPLPGAVAISIKDGRTKYRAGEMVYPDGFTYEPFSEHTPGIFFYLDRMQAVHYLCAGDDSDGKPKPLDIKQFEDGKEETGFGTPPQILDHLINDPLKELAFALKYLPEDQVAAVVMKYVDYYPNETIAQTLKITEEEVENLLKHAEEMLAKAV